MWIAENIVKNKNSSNNCMNATISSSSNSEITAVGRDGISRLMTVAPSGISFSPKIDENAVVLKTDNGDVCIGTIMEKISGTDYPSAGELFLSNKDGTAYIKLLSGGIIEIGGNIIIKGNIILNGKEI